MDLTHLRFSGAPTIPPRRASLARHAHSGAASRPLDLVVVAPGPALPSTGLAATLLARAGLDPDAYRATPLQRRVPACLRALGVTSEAAALRALQREPAPRAEALSALLLGVTSFFRDDEVFARLERQVVPRLRGLDRAPRVLSVGCASGAELYSVAMLLAEAGLIAGATLTGIDARPDAIAAARGGVFAPAALTGLSDARRHRHLEPAPGGERIAGRLRQHTTWRLADATRGLPPGPWDLVLCRNLIIYLQAHCAATLYARLRGALAPGGVLVLGRAERPPRALGLQPLGPSLHHAPGV